VPRKSVVLLHIRLERSDEIDGLLENSDLDMLVYDKQWKQYRLRLQETDLVKNIDIIKSLVSQAKDKYMS